MEYSNVFFCSRKYLLLYAIIYGISCQSLRYLPHSQSHFAILPYRLSHNFKRESLIIYESTLASPKNGINSFTDSIQNIAKVIAACIVVPFMFGFHSVSADDELAKFAAEGNSVGVDGKCFFKKCSLETAKCGNDPTCLKGLSCLARCKGASMCSTGCFAKFGSNSLDDLLYCSVEKNDCVQVPGKENIGWSTDAITDLPSKPITPFNLKSLDGTWYKVMGLDSRYDCFDCQRNSFASKDKNTLSMEAIFRIPRPNFPGYLQNRIFEELHSSNEMKSLATMQSKGKMFGLTFWENWYILGDSKLLLDYKQFESPTILEDNNEFKTPNGIGVPSAYAASRVFGQVQVPDLKLVYYTGHTLQGNYKGAFLYSKTPTLSPQDFQTAVKVISSVGLNPNDFCIVKNQCFLPQSPEGDGEGSSSSKQQISPEKDELFWYLGQRFFQVTNGIASELADWFEDPAILSDWLVSQQEHMVFGQPLAVSPFASLPELPYSPKSDKIR